MYVVASILASELFPERIHDGTDALVLNTFCFAISCILQRLAHLGGAVCPRTLRPSKPWPRLMNQSTLTMSYPNITKIYLKNMSQTRSFGIMDGLKNRYDERADRKQKEMFDAQV